MNDNLDAFCRAQQQRIRRRLQGRAGELEDIPVPLDRQSLVVETRGNATGHATGRKKPPSDEQSLKGGGALMPGKRRQPVLWTDLERKHGRLEKRKADDHG